MKTSLLALASSFALALGACAAGDLSKSSESMAVTDGDGGALPDGARPGCMGGPHGPPPAEAIAACDGVDVGAACSFTLDGGTLQGICRSDPMGQGPNACAPAGMGPDGKPLGPPPEAIAACSGASSGATCSFTIDGHALDGTCEPGPDASAPLACRPANAPPPPPPSGG